MKHLIFTLIIISSFLRAQLNPVVSFPEVQAFIDVSFIDNLRGFIVASDGKVYGTITEGTYFPEVVIPGNKGVLAVDTKPDGIVFLAGKQGMVMISTDAGATWNDVSVAALPGAVFTIVKRISSRSVMVAGENGVFARSDDNGAHWQHTYIGDLKINNLVFTSWLEGWALMNSGGIAHTTDGGSSWSRFNTSKLSDNLKGFLKIGDRMLIVGDNGLMSHSLDGGLTWFINNTWEYTDVVGCEQTGDGSLLIMDVAGKLFEFTLDATGLHKTGINTSPRPRRTFYGFWKNGARIYAVTDGPNFYTSKSSGLTFSSSIVTFAGRTFHSLQASGENEITVVANSPFVDGVANGYIGRTTDGGLTWKYIYDGGWAAAAHFFPGGKIIRALEKTIQYSNDNGVSWTTLASPNKGVIISSQAIDDQSGYHIVTDTLSKPSSSAFSEIYKRNWTSSTLIRKTNSARYTDLNFINSQNGWVLVDSNRFLTTTNAGATWSESQAITPKISSYTRIGNASGIFVSRGGKISKTTDNAKTWTTLLDDPGFRFNSVSAFDSMRITVACDSGFIYSSKNGGASWSSIRTGLSVDFSKIKMTDSTTFVITSTTGGVYRGDLKNFDSNNGTTVLNTLPTEMVTGNFPNPFNPETVIRFALPVAGYARGVVYDILGREVATLVNGEMPAGEHRLSFNASNLPSGVYIFRLESGKYSAAIKMVLSK